MRPAFVCVSTLRQVAVAKSARSFPKRRSFAVMDYRPEGRYDAYTLCGVDGGEVFRCPVQYAAGDPVALILGKDGKPADSPIVGVAKRVHHYYARHWHATLPSEIDLAAAVDW